MMIYYDNVVAAALIVVWPKGQNVQDFERLRTPPVNFWPKGQRLQFDVNIKDKTCNLLYKKISTCHSTPASP
ncbi:hypothetical protein Hdeb2414_s0008g00273491 [Helianthus debilis subsp. tardiflorus]